MTTVKTNKAAPSKIQTKDTVVLQTASVQQPSAAVQTAAPVQKAAPTPQPAAIIPGSLSDQELKDLLVSLRAEQKRRDEARLSSLPQPGDVYRVVSGSKRLVGKEGSVISSGKSRVFLNLEVNGRLGPYYLKIADLERA